MGFLAATSKTRTMIVGRKFYFIRQTGACGYHKTMFDIGTNYLIECLINSSYFTPIFNNFELRTRTIL